MERMHESCSAICVDSFACNWKLIVCLKARRAPPCHTACFLCLVDQRYTSSSCSACLPGVARTQDVCLPWLSGVFAPVDMAIWIEAKLGHAQEDTETQCLYATCSNAAQEHVCKHKLFDVSFFFIDKKGGRAILQMQHGCLALNSLWVRRPFS